MGSGLALWLDPSNLGPIGTRVSTWCDQSGKSNHAFAYNLAALPQVITQGTMLSYGMEDAAFVVSDSPSIDMGADDFVVLVVAGISHGDDAKSFFRKFATEQIFPKEVMLAWMSQGETVGFRVVGKINETTAVSTIATPAGQTARLYGLRRVGNQIEVRVNGQIVSPPMPLLTPGGSTKNVGDVFIGEFDYYSNRSIDFLGAVVVVRGVLGADDLGQLERGLMDAFGLAM